MPSPFIGGRIPQDLHNHLKSHMEQTGEKLTDILKTALASYLNHPLAVPTTPATEVTNERFSDLESRIEVLEETVRKIAFQEVKTSEKPPIGSEPSPDQLSLLEVSTSKELDNPQGESEPSIMMTGPTSEEDREPELPTIELEEITVQEMSRRTGIKLSTLGVYRSQGKEVVKEGFRFKPLGKKGIAMWLVEKTSS